MILHTLNQPPSSAETCTRCLNAIAAADSLLLIENAVYGAVQNAAFSEKMAAISAQGKLFVLTSDFTGRGLKAENLLQGSQLIGYEEFVSLVCLHDKCIAWF